VGELGDGRFVLLETLGQGGMGVVYRALDRAQNAEVALKTLREIGPSTILRFKTEFRALQDVAHPNLVALYELISSRGDWYFTMELIDGVDLLHFVRGEELPTMASGTDSRHGEQASEPQSGGMTSPNVVGQRSPHPALTACPTTIDYDRVVNVVAQLAEGVSALHDSGHLHRDIKPSNIMVTSESRVVLLDFGVIAEVSGRRWSRTSLEVAGTPAYMAPEQATSVGASPASDWYGVGTVLFELLTGTRPFVGRRLQVLRDKQMFEPPPPSRLRSDVPEFLDQLCIDLLRKDHRLRPTGDDVLRRLGVLAVAPRRRPAMDEPELVGRGAHLAALDRAMAQVRSGTGQVVYVHGSSGLGKSALISRFLTAAIHTHDAVVIAGRCYERETVPYKAVDSLVDALCQFLLGLPDDLVAALAPHDVRYLARAFPVLLKIPAVAAGKEPAAAQVPEPGEIRRRAFVALRALLTNMARRWPLVLAIDDLQWGDTDSAPLLDGLMRPPDPPPLLLLLTYRSEDEPRSPLLRALLHPQYQMGAAVPATTLQIGPLSAADAEELAAQLLKRADLATDAAASIARESRGSPFFIHQLVHYAEEDHSDATSTLTLDTVIRARISQLPDPARRLLEVISVAGKPLAMDIAERAAGIAEGEVPDVVQKLRAFQFVRAIGSGANGTVESYHDRIRISVAEALTAAQAQQYHRQLADAVESSAQPDPESLVAYYRGAGDDAAAARYAVAAAALAAAALSFERAAELYRVALSLGKHTTEAERDLRIKLAEVLEAAGRGGDAGKEYLAAATLSEGTAALDLRRRAAEQQLRSGYIPEGIDTMTAVLAEVGLSFPTTALRGIARFLYWQTRLRLRGTAFRTATGDPNPDRAMVVDVCWSTVTGLGMVHPPRSVAFSTLGFLRALDLGDPRRIVRAATVEAVNTAAMGARAAKRAERIAGVADSLPEAAEDPYMRGLRMAAEGAIAFMHGHFSNAHEHCERALRYFKDFCHGSAWEIGTCVVISLSALEWTGQLRALASITPSRLAEADLRGDRFTVTTLRAIVTPALCLIADDPASAHREATEALQLWVQGGFLVQHFQSLWRRTEADRYVGDGRSALARCQAAEKPLARALLMQVQIVKYWWHYIRGTCAVSAAVDDASDRAALLKMAARDARTLRRSPVPWPRGLGELLAGNVAFVRGDSDQAAQWLRSAEAQLRAADLAMHASAARHRLGQLVGGSEGQALMSDARQHVAEQGVVNPTAMLRVYAPGGDPP
jgi:eukaryotic-like serine/threonine-protein kinase